VKSKFLHSALPFALACCLAACSGPGTQKQVTAPVPEIMPGVLQGYLPMKTPLQSVVFVPAAPQEGSARQQLDDAVSAYAVTLRDTPRWEMAQHDSHLSFPAAADTFSCALDIPISETETPALYMLLRRTLSDMGLASYSAKNAYSRPRPFMINDEPICTSDKEENLRGDGSYPSGHTSIGWGWALMLAELAPDRAEAVLARGRAYGESRIVCNVHWYSDVVAGRMVGAAAVATLHANTEFLQAMAAAREDIASARKRGLTAARDCAAEQENLSLGL
jgi:acid phosphatase (class A)